MDLIDNPDEDARIQHIIKTMMMLDADIASSGRRGDLAAIDEWYDELYRLIDLYGVDHDRVMERVEAGDASLP
jgi:ParB-like chromosome segregation protein Spo0J